MEHKEYLQTKKLYFNQITVSFFPFLFFRIL